MDSIYHHSNLNIAATGFADGENGIFVKRDPNLLIPIAVNLEEDQYLASEPQSDKNRRYREARKGNYYLVTHIHGKTALMNHPCVREGG